MNSNVRILSAVALLAALSACGGPQYLRPGLGDAVQRNMASHIVDPEPDKETTPAPMEGSRAALAVERYKAGKVIKPKSVKITIAGGS